jgi:Ca2+-binding EF-hand superfamily protein
LGSTTLSFCQEKDKERGKDKKPPTIEELFKQMDANKDAKLSKKEVKGPLKDNFDKIDTNKDGFLTKEELEKAPKPKRQMRLDK